MNIELLREGTPEQQAALLELAAAARRAERHRAAVVSVVLADYEAALSNGGQEAIDRAADFVRELRGADQNHGEEMGKAIDRTFKALSGGRSMGDFAKCIAEAMGGLGVVGFAIDIDGNPVPMTPDGPLDDEIPDEALRVIADLVKVPGMLPPEVSTALGERIANLAVDLDGAPADGDLSFLEGIDLDSEATPLRDFDGGVG